MLEKDEIMLDDDFTSSEIIDNESSRERYSCSARKKLEEHMEMIKLRKLLDDFYYEED